ncbi:A disintegrin and metalloproteinase with thrombospondin motifs 6-like isoform X4 [Haliotis rubra]|uniref:A disintegrin and metalloproteinase with thrombospondin motifs 6-like isoform X4 n=1 Tax=Haliotis rubra TaxID=36100 RepID=UPI001EE62F3A|nr:A disintegrin and metalloproteinase with thrombospondin motifs 6-like isoform X4 [Haliotis rubra]
MRTFVCYFVLSVCVHLVSGKKAYVQLTDTTLTDSSDCQLPTTIHITVTADGRSLPLTLTKNTDVDVNAPIYTTSFFRDDEVEKENLFDIPDSAEYQDEAQYAAMTVECHKLDKRVDISVRGMITLNGKQYTIERKSRQRRDTDATSDAGEYEITEDVAPVTSNDYREAPPAVEDAVRTIKESHQLLPLKDATLTRHKRQSSQYVPLKGANLDRQKRQVSQYYIDVLALVDFGVYKRWYDVSTQPTADQKKIETLQNIRRYYAYVMNGVSLRYKSISSLNSRINVRLVGYYVAESGASSPFTESFRISGSSGSEVDADKVLVYLRDWVTRTSLPANDHVMMFSGYDLYTINPATNTKSTATSGLAYISTMCRSDGRSISLVEDIGGFQCIDTAAHELGHGLGAKHDGDGNNCKPSDRFIMSGGSYKTTDQNERNPWFFSSCSVDYFRNLLASLSRTSTGIQCITNALPVTNVPDTSSVLPGQLYNPNQQCQMIHGASSRLCMGPEFGNYSQICSNMFCLDPSSVSTCFLHDAARGTTCGDRKWCIDGVCQYAPEAPSANENCVFGDQSGVAFEGQTCEDFTGGENSPYCYQQVVRGRCCASCNRYYTGVESCLYGNTVRGCDARFCDYIYEDGTRYADNCCQTCGQVVPITTTTTTTTTRAPVTTTMTTTKTTTKAPVPTTIPNTQGDDCTGNLGDRNGITFNGMSCADYVNSDSGVCYSESTQNYCCSSCRQKETGIQGCRYGDKSPSICSGLTTPLETSCKGLEETCCNTCKSVISGSDRRTGWSAMSAILSGLGVALVALFL